MTRQLTHLSDADMRELVAAIRARRITAPFTALSLQRIVQSTAAPASASALQQLSDLGFGSEQIVTTLELILEDRRRHGQAGGQIDLVTSGPEAAGVTNRDTAVVVRELFAQARKSVLVAGYAVYQGQQVFQALAERMQELPDLNVEMFLDIQRPHGDSSEPRELARRFAHRFKTQQWPLGKPLPTVYYDPRSLEPTSHERACLHAKCVVVDSKTVFLSSANFTEAAQERNIELGLLVSSQVLAEQIVWHFRALLAEGHLVEVIRR